jgi:hypothetical protein
MSARPVEPGAAVGSFASGTTPAESSKEDSLTLKRASSISAKCSRKAVQSRMNSARLMARAAGGDPLPAAALDQPCLPIHLISPSRG